MAMLCVYGGECCGCMSCAYSQLNEQECADIAVAIFEEQ